MISEVSGSNAANSNQLKNNSQQIKAAKTATKQEITEVNADSIELGTTKSTSAIYEKPHSKKLSDSDIQALRAEADRANANLRALVEKLLLKQGKATGQWQNGQKSTEIDSDAVEQAKLSISEDGEYGVKAVSDRIVDFAIAISGNDKEKLSELKAAIDKGFKEAEKAFGGTLPDICYETYDETIKKLDKWGSEGQE